METEIIVIYALKNKYLHFPVFIWMTMNMYLKEEPAANISILCLYLFTNNHRKVPFKKEVQIPF